jgi:hypothetical protein
MKSTLRTEYDFSQAQRGAVIPSPGKTRITITLDDDVIEYFRVQAEVAGVGYQASMTALLRAAMTATSTVQPDPLALTEVKRRRATDAPHDEGK